jgi:hypothetical protein
MGGRQVWKGLYAESFTQAKKEAQLSSGVPAESRTVAAVQPETVRTLNRVPLATAVDTYLEQKSGKSQKTVYQYKRTLDEFREVVGRKVRYLDEVTENVLRTYKKSMETEGYAGKTIDPPLYLGSAAWLTDWNWIAMSKGETPWPERKARSRRKRKS